MFGTELIIDLKECSLENCNRGGLTKYFKELCDLIDMNREDLHFWDYTNIPSDEIPYDQTHLVGTSAVQFITTSNITIHTIDLRKEIYINIFSCKPFDKIKTLRFTKTFFDAKQFKWQVLIRGAFDGSI